MPEAAEADILKAGTCQIIYDGGCPVCRAYVGLQGDGDGTVALVDGRADGSQNRALLQEGIDLDEGIVVRLGGETFHGAEALHRLAQHARPTTALQRINRVLFGNRLVSRIIYPPLRAGRNLLLRLLRRPPINGARDEAA